ncbi:SGNH/GDSL hydrolase family protein [Singulisphaera sp. PoT]|uniref:SGNH/GDSL hydrolase family protein n=1 Tax=Singulisphaera sp. PoT TaxID=3411797 RepID=UPI003BF56A5F
MKHASLVALGLLGLILVPPIRAASPGKLELKDGDRVVLIGDTFIERDQKYGYLETLLTLRNPGKRIVFRNLGWSGDSVFGDARAGFGTRADGFKQLRDHVLGLKPTVIIVGYGMSDSFSGPKGVDAFVAGLDTLMGVFEETKAKVVVLSPLGHEDLGRPLPNPSSHVANLDKYAAAIADAARKRGLLYVDLLHEKDLWNYSSETRSQKPPLTDNGIHLTAPGAWTVSNILASELQPAASPWVVELKADGTLARAEGTKILKTQAASNGLIFQTQDATLPTPPAPKGTRAPAEGQGTARTLKVVGLPEGMYSLTIDGKPVLKANAEALRNLTLNQGPEFAQVEALRTLINEKNLLYFHRWRPQNETYLFGFRKHEQGNNAREIPLFDPLVEEKEREILSLSLPATHVYELIRESEVGK